VSLGFLTASRSVFEKDFQPNDENLDGTTDLKEKPL
jgi:hypothetical protein